MTNIRIGGRTPEQIIQKRLEELARQPNGSPPPSPPPSPTPPGTATPENGADFDIDDIVKNPQGNYEFKGLTVPGGIWSSITLASQPLENGASLNYTQWVDYSDGKAGLDKDGKFVQLPRPVVRDFRITPAKVRYWVMRATYEKRNSPKHQGVVQELRTLFHKDGNQLYPHNADLIEYRAGQPTMITVQGWPAGHPFCTPPTTEAAIAGISPTEIKAGCGLEKALGALVGDQEPSRVKEVLEYHFQPRNNTSKLWREAETYTGKRVVVFGVIVGAGIYADGSIGNGRPARGVFADAKNFHRK